MKKEKKVFVTERKEDLINLNSELLETVSIDELEERLELTGISWFCSDCCSSYGHGCFCYQDHM